MFPAGVESAWHGSGVVTPSGNFLYVYVGEDDIREAKWAGWVQLLHDKIANEDVNGVWFEGNPDSDDLIIDSYGGIPLWEPVCTVFWEGGQLWLVANYGTLDDDDVWHGGWTHLYLSPSGEGGDWTLYDTIQAKPGDLTTPNGVADRVAGPPTVVGGEWVMSIAWWDDGGNTQPAIWKGTPGGGWTKVHSQGFGPGGAFGGMGSRMVNEGPSGSLLWSAWSGSFDATGDPGLTRFVGAESTDGGNSWTAYPSPELNYGNPEDDVQRHQFLGTGVTFTYRANNSHLEQSLDPVDGPWEAMWPLNLDRGRDAQSMLWREIVPGVWLLFSHDKVWWMFGGWVVGAIGHS
jgi:hypothetical protein